MLMPAPEHAHALTVAGRGELWLPASAHRAAVSSPGSAHSTGTRTSITRAVLPWGASTQLLSAWYVTAPGGGAPPWMPLAVNGSRLSRLPAPGRGERCRCPSSPLLAG